MGSWKWVINHHPIIMALLGESIPTNLHFAAVVDAMTECLPAVLLNNATELSINAELDAVLWWSQTYWCGSAKVSTTIWYRNFRGHLNRIKQTRASAAKTTQSMRKMRRMQHLLDYAPWHLKLVMAWWNRYGFSSCVGKPPLQLVVSHYKWSKWILSLHPRRFVNSYAQ